MKKDIFASKWFFCILLIAFLKPDGIAAYSILDTLFNVWFTISGVAVILLAVVTKYKTSRYAKFVVGLQVYLILITCYRTSTFSLSTLKNTIGAIFLTILIDMWIKKKPKQVLNSLLGICFGLILLTAVCGNGKLFPEYLIGRRTTITTELLPAFLLVFFVASKKTNEMHKLEKSFSILISGVILAYLAIKESVATSIVGIMVFILLLLYLKFCYLKKIKSNIIIITILAINVLIIFFQSIKVFGWLIQNVLGKSLTLTGRFQIWSDALSSVEGHRIFGNGVLQTNVMYGWDNSGVFLHNTLLQFLVDGGLIAFVLFIICLLIMGKCNDLSVNREQQVIMIASSGCLLVTMITEVMTQHLYLYIIMTLMANMNYISAPIFINARKKDIRYVNLERKNRLGGNDQK